MSERSSMISRSASERADALRDNLRGLRDVDALLEEAGRLKREAVAEAEQLVAEAQTLADDLVGEARGQAEQVVSEARTTAEETQGRLDSVLGEVESGVRELGGHLEGALRSVNALARTLEGVRTGQPPAAPGPEGSSLPVLAAGQTEPDAAEAPTADYYYETDERGDDAGARPLGWLFRATTQG